MNTIIKPTQNPGDQVSDWETELKLPSGSGLTSRRMPSRSAWQRWILGLSLAIGIVSCGLWLRFALMAPEPLAEKPPEPLPPETNRKKVGKNVFLEVQGDVRRVVVLAKVCLREGPLEGLMCRHFTKEHEYILDGDVDGRLIHATLIAAGAKPGNPVKFDPMYVPATGATIKVTLQYEKDGKRIRVPAQDWIRNGKDGNKVLEKHWVFGGSLFVKDMEEPDKEPIYLANHGDLICVVNMESAMLDIPVRSPKTFDSRVYTAFTDRIPPLETPVEVILEPIIDRK